MKLVLKILLVPTLIVYAGFLIITKILVYIGNFIFFKLAFLALVVAFLSSMASSAPAKEVNYMIDSALVLYIYGFIASFIMEALTGVQNYMIDFLKS